MTTYSIENIEFLRKHLVEAEEKRLNFRCPECCNDTLIYTCEENVHAQGVVSRHEGAGGREWFLSEFDYDDLDRHYSCSKCGYTLTDEDGDEICNEEQLADWLMANCPQDDQGTDGQNSE